MRKGWLQKPSSGSQPLYLDDLIRAAVQHGCPVNVAWDLTFGELMMVFPAGEKGLSANNNLSAAVLDVMLRERAEMYGRMTVEDMIEMAAFLEAAT